MTTRLRKDESSHLIPFVKQDDRNTYVKVFRPVNWN